MLSRIAILAVVGLLGILLCIPASADSNLTVGVGGKGIDATVYPGESYSQPLYVSIGEDGLASNVVIEVKGGSAESFISPSNLTIHVEPGAMVQVDTIVSIPKDIDEGEYDTEMHFTASPSVKSGQVIASEIVLPMKFTIAGESFGDEPFMFWLIVSVAVGCISFALWAGRRKLKSIRKGILPQ